MYFADLNLTEQVLQRSAEINRARSEVELMMGLICSETTRHTPSVNTGVRRFEGEYVLWTYIRTPKEGAQFRCYLGESNVRTRSFPALTYSSLGGVAAPFDHMDVRSVRAALPILVDGMVALVPKLGKTLRDFVQFS
jgi:hypothetical protein